jgi:hypothetical protein
MSEPLSIEEISLFKSSMHLAYSIFRYWKNIDIKIQIKIYNNI